jgi:hypothetical protein
MELNNNGKPHGYMGTDTSAAWPVRFLGCWAPKLLELQDES